MKARMTFCALALAGLAFSVVAQVREGASPASPGSGLLGMSDGAREAELAAFLETIEPLKSADAPRTWHETQALQDRVAEALEAMEVLRPSKLEQWQARDDLIELVFDADAETAHFLYGVVQAALHRREELLKESDEFRLQLEANAEQRNRSR